MTAALVGKKFFGAGRMFGINNVTNPTPTRFSIPQDMSITTKRETKSLFGENQLAEDVSSGSMEVSGKITYGVSNPRVWADLMFGDAGATGQTLQVDSEADTVGTSPYTITVVNSANWTEDLGVVDVLTGAHMVCVASAPVAGVSYTVAAGVYTFATGDSGKARKISYLYTSASTGETVALNNQPMGRVGGFTGVMVFPWTNPSNVVEQDVLTLVNCIGSDSEIAVKMGDYGKPTFGFSAAVGANENLGSFSFAEAA